MSSELLFVDTTDRSTYASPEAFCRSSSDTTEVSFAQRAYWNSFRKLSATVLDVATPDGASIPASLMYADGDDPQKLLINFMPFSDSLPASDPRDMYAFHLDLTRASKIKNYFNKEFVCKPHSWGPLVRAAVMHDEIAASGRGMPVLNLYNPMPGKALTRFDKSNIYRGNFSAFASLASYAVNTASDIISGKNSAFSEFYFSGQSIGGVRTIHAAREFQNSHGNVRGVTAQEVVTYNQKFLLRGLKHLANDYAINKYDNSYVHDLEKPETFIRIPENELRTYQDGYGAEPIGMLSRMIRGMVPRDMVGLTRSLEVTTDAIQDLAETGAAVTLANTSDSAVSREMRMWLLQNGKHMNNLHEITAVPLRGQKLGHMVNEYATTTGLIVARGIQNASF